MDQRSLILNSNPLSSVIEATLARDSPFSLPPTSTTGVLYQPDVAAGIEAAKGASLAATLRASGELGVICEGRWSNLTQLCRGIHNLSLRSSATVCLSSPFNVDPNPRFRARRSLHGRGGPAGQPGVPRPSLLVLPHRPRKVHLCAGGGRLRSEIRE